MTLLTYLLNYENTQTFTHGRFLTAKHSCVDQHLREADTDREGSEVMTQGSQHWPSVTIHRARDTCPDLMEN